jgi:hypothetical protein
MELLILLIIALILLAWRINSEMSAIQPPSYPLIQKKQEEQSNFFPIEDEEDRIRKLNLADDSYNGLLADSSSSSSFLNDDSTSSHDIYTDPSYCHLPGNIYYHICHDDDNRSSIGAVLTGTIGLQVGLMIGEVVRGIAGAVPVGIVKLGL